jgi:hypothetical protein
MGERLLNNELEIVWNEVVMTQYGTLFRHSHKESKEIRKIFISVRIISV